MNESMFIHMDAVYNDTLDLNVFQREFHKKYRGLEIRPASDSRQYCLEWRAVSEKYAFSGMMDRRRVTFVIDCFQSENRERDLAEQILWFHSWFPQHASVICCDDSYCRVCEMKEEVDAEALRVFLS